MATQFTEYPAAPVQRSFSWTGIFAGTFLFLAIEATFGVLGAAIFASAANPLSANPVGAGVATGFGIWMVVLSIISLYFAGKLAARLSGAPTRNLGMHAGFVTYGMSVFTTVLVLALVTGATVAGGTGLANESNVRVAGILTTGGYWTFIAMVLGMFAAAMGGMHGASSGGLRVTTSTTRTVPPSEERRAA